MWMILRHFAWSGGRRKCLSQTVLLKPSDKQRNFIWPNIATDDTMIKWQFLNMENGNTLCRNEIYSEFQNSMSVSVMKPDLVDQQSVHNSLYIHKWHLRIFFFTINRIADLFSFYLFVTINRKKKQKGILIFHHNFNSVEIKSEDKSRQIELVFIFILENLTNLCKSKRLSIWEK